MQYHGIKTYIIWRDASVNLSFNIRELSERTLYPKRFETISLFVKQKYRDKNNVYSQNQSNGQSRQLCETVQASNSFVFTTCLAERRGCCLYCRTTAEIRKSIERIEYCENELLSRLQQAIYCRLCSFVVMVHEKPADTYVVML